MKLVAHSLVPSNPLPYTHLGYISAMPMNNAAPALVLTLILIAAAGYAWQKSWLWGCGFLLLAMLSIRLIAYQYTEGKQQLALRQTKASAESIFSGVIVLAANGEEIPNDRETLSQSIGVPLEDGWGRPYRWKQRTEHGVLHCILTSGGPDGEYSTADDIVAERDIKLPQQDLRPKLTEKNLTPP